MRHKLRTAGFFGLLVVACLPSGGEGQVLEPVKIPSSFNPVGSGARALGMGGAFIAVADDATAASWNPGGLIQLERPEMSVVGSFFSRADDNRFGAAPEADGRNPVDKESVNYLSAAYPFVLKGHNMVVSVNYQQLYDLSRSWSFTLRDSSAGGTIGYVQSGELGATGLAYCLQVTPALSAGITVNFWGRPAGLQTWEEHMTVRTDDHRLTGEPYSVDSLTHERFRFEGVNVNLGVLWRVTERLTTGAVLKTPFRAELRHRISKTVTFVYPESPTLDREASETIERKGKLDMPLSFGLGVSYRFSDAVTGSLDVYRTRWRDFVFIDQDGNRTVPTTGASGAESGLGSTHQIRAGLEYLLIGTDRVIPLRFGMFYDPAPAEDSPDDYYGFSLGTGLVWASFSFDLAYQYRFGKGVGESNLQNFGFSQDVGEHTVYSSLILYF